MPSWDDGGEERGGAYPGAGALGLGDWIPVSEMGTQGGLDLEERSRRLLDMWVCSSGTMKLDRKILECKPRGGN